MDPIQRESVTVTKPPRPEQLLEQPHVCLDLRVDCEQHDAPTSDPYQLAKAPLQVCLVVQRQYGQRRVDGSVSQRQALRDTEHSRR